MKRVLIPAALLCLAALAADNAAGAPKAAVNLQSTICNLKSADAITIPQMLSYQGKLTDTLGQPVADTLYAIRFRLYAQPTGGTHFWEENQNVGTTDGLFSVLLGSVTPIGSVPDAGALYLGMAVAGGAELTPRLRLASAAYAYQSARAADADLLQGRDTSAFDARYVNEGQADAVTGAMLVDGTVLTADVGDTAVTMAKVARAGATTGQVVKWTGSAWAPGPDNTGGGSGVTNVYQDTGIICVPNPITSNGNVKLDLPYSDGRYVNATGDSMTGVLRVQGDLRVYGKGRIGPGNSNAGNAAFVAGEGNTASANYSSVSGGADNTASGIHAHVGGGGESRAAGDYSAVGGGAMNYAAGGRSTVAGGSDNEAYGLYAAIGGGYVNTAGDATGDTCATVAGGKANLATARFATVGGGTLNAAAGLGASIAGGAGNVAGDATSDTAATIAGGYGNRATGRFAAVGGGQNDTASGDWSTVGGGTKNTAIGNFATVAGGQRNSADTLWATVGGGSDNNATGMVATVAGGSGNSADGRWATVGGGFGNNATGHAATIAGGSTNSADANYATVGGGFSNSATGAAATVAGGEDNSADTSFATVGGGRWNHATGVGATVAGGQENIADTSYTTVSGGWSNNSTGYYATVGGGYRNCASASGANVGGGIYDTASAINAVVAGGAYNVASGSYASVVGGRSNAACGRATLAAGNYARANHGGSFVWSDSCSVADSVYTGGVNQWRVRARGGAWFYSNLAKSTGAYLAPGSNSWESACDSMTKEDFRPVDRRELLDKVAALRVRDYKMRDQNDGTRHIGPVAQDFQSAFGYGGNETSINMADADGVLLAAVQALYEQNQNQQADIEALKAKLAGK